MHRPQVKLLRRSPVVQLIAKPNLVFLQLNRSLEIKRRNVQADARAQYTTFPCFRIQGPGRSPHFPVIGQIASLPGARSNGGKALVQADERTVLKIIVWAIPEKLPSAGRMPQPFASGTQIFERDESRAEFRNHRQLDLLIAQNEHFKPLFAPHGTSVAHCIHGFISLRKSAASAWFGSRRSTV